MSQNLIFEYQNHFKLEVPLLIPKVLHSKARSAAAGSTWIQNQTLEKKSQSPTFLKYITHNLTCIPVLESWLPQQSPTRNAYLKGGVIGNSDLGFLLAMKQLYPWKECLACQALDQHGLPSMFENGEADYDEHANIALPRLIGWNRLLAPTLSQAACKPRSMGSDVSEAELLSVVRWMKASGRLQLPAAWPADFP